MTDLSGLQSRVFLLVHGRKETFPRHIRPGFAAMKNAMVLAPDDYADSSSFKNTDAKAEEPIEDAPTSDIYETGTVEGAITSGDAFRTSTGDSTNTHCNHSAGNLSGEAEEAAASAIKDDDDDSDDMRDASCCYRIARNWTCCYHTLLGWPRTSAILLGVILPMFFLIFLSVLFGFFLARAETPLEIQQNDAAMVQSMLQLSTVRFVVNTTDTIPALCLGLYFLQQNVSSLDEYLLEHLLGPGNSSLAAQSPELVSPGREVSVNTSETLQFMVQCGQVAGSIVERTIRNTSAIYRDEVPGDLTFNWVRCYPGARGLGQAGESPTSIDEYRFNAQYEWYAKTWKQSQNETYQALLAEYLADSANSSTTTEEAVLRAKNESYQLATGASGCSYNVPSSGKTARGVLRGMCHPVLVRCVNARSLP